MKNIFRLEKKTNINLLSYITIIISLLISLSTTIFFINKYRYKKINKIYLFLLSIINSLSILYIINEFYYIKFFDELEILFTNLFFFFCFFNFFSSLKNIFCEDKKFFKFVLVINFGNIIYGIFDFYLKSNLFSCSEIYLFFKLIFTSIFFITFFLLTFCWLNFVIKKILKELKKNQRKNSDLSIIYLDRKFLIYKLYTFQNLICCFFFIQIFQIVKIIFYYLLNQNFVEEKKEFNYCFSIYRKEEITFFNDFNFNEEFEIFESLEIFLRIIFCFALPVFWIMKILEDKNINKKKRFIKNVEIYKDPFEEDFINEYISEIKD